MSSGGAFLFWVLVVAAGALAFPLLVYFTAKLWALGAARGRQLADRLGGRHGKTKE